jgi:hypothetical protein
MSAMNVNVSQVIQGAYGGLAPVEVSMLETNILTVEGLVPAFNASITVTELLTKTLENAAKELAARCIRECASKYGFVADDEIRALGLENLNLIKKKMTKKSGSKKAVIAVQKKEKKSVFPMPFEGSSVVETNCQGLSFNRGLFTQCSKEKMENSSFCKGCQTEADKNSSGCPDCGTVACRLATDLYSFKDPKGRSPVSYVKLLEKLKLSVEDALTEAGNKNIELSNDHFTVVEKSSKGRPKKSAKPVESSDNAGDLFAKLTAEHEEDMFEMDDLDKDNSSKASNKAKLSDEEKALKKAALEEERAAKKLLAQQQREAAIALEKEAKKLERDTKAALEKEAKKVERETKAAEEKAARETKAAEEKAARETKAAEEKAARETKVAEEKAAREAKRLLEKELKKELKKESKKAASPKTTPVVVVAPVSPPVKKVCVTRMAFEGTQYLKSENNILYNPETREEVGIWDPETKTIKELPEDEESDEEEEEEGYETN